MKLSSKTIIPVLLAATATSGAALATDMYGPAPSWDGYKSVSSSMPISRSYNDIEANNTNTESTQTDNSKSAVDSFNREAAFDLDATADSYNDNSSEATQTDNSKSAADSFNRSAAFDLDSTADSYNDNSSESAQTDNSKSAVDSFNRAAEFDLDASKRMKDSYNTDNSKQAADSFNTDNSKHAADSFNTDSSNKDSFNTTTKQRWQAVTDAMTANPIVTTAKDVSAGDVQGASNSNSMSGPNQIGMQGGLDIGGVGNDAPSCCGGYGSEYGYGGQDNRSASNAQEIGVYGPNLGAVSNTSVTNLGRDQVFGPNRSVLGSDFGNKQIFSAGPQTQLQKNEQLKAGDTSATAMDTISNSASKSSKTRQ